MSELDFSKFLGHGTVVPSDVTFLILGNTDEGVEFKEKVATTGHKEEGDYSTGKVTAHKHCLALASPVFRTLFYGLEVADVIKVKNTTIGAFMSMIDFIYKKTVDVSIMTTQQLYELVRLAEQYQLPSLRDLVYGPWDIRPTDGIPSDVKFKVVEEKVELEEENEIIEEEVSETKEEFIHAHKYHLALASDVFEAQFFGGLPCDDVVTVRGTTFDALKTVIDHLYGRNENLEEKTMTQLFDILNQAEMYTLEELKMFTTAQIFLYPLTEENVIDVAFSVDNYKHFDIVEDVWEMCSDFLYENVFKTMKDISKFAGSYNETRKAMIAMKLLAIPSVCSNCDSIPCLNGTTLKPPYADKIYKDFFLLQSTSRNKYFSCKFKLISKALQKDGKLLMKGSSSVNWNPAKVVWACRH